MNGHFDWIFQIDFDLKNVGMRFGMYFPWMIWVRLLGDVSLYLLLCFDRLLCVYVRSLLWASKGSVAIESRRNMTHKKRNSGSNSSTEPFFRAIFRSESETKESLPGFVHFVCLFPPYFPNHSSIAIEILILRCCFYCWSMWEINEIFVYILLSF